MRRADQRKYHYIYKITRDDGRYYIGMHSTDDLEDGYFGSGKLITHSIKKHGLERHVKEILEFLSSREVLKIREKDLVNEELLQDPLCMNLICGGLGNPFTEEIQRIATENSKSLESHAKRKQTLLAKGKYNNWPRAGNIASNLPEPNLKRKEKMSGHIRQQGEKNSQFGSVWVTNGVTPIKIKKERLDEYLTNGYRRGRKLVL